MEVYILSNYSDLISKYYSINPKEVEGLNNTSYFYYFNILLSKLYSVFDFENIPDYWDKNYIKSVICSKGYFGVVEYHGDPWALSCSRSGIDIYGKPTTIIISNPVAGTFERQIGKGGELVYLNYMFENKFFTPYSIIQRYRLLLAQIDGSLNTSLINSRVAHIFERENDGERKTFQKLYDDISMGKPVVVIKKGNSSLKNANILFNNVKNTYIGNDLLETKKTIYNEFLTEIGINNSNTDKKERLITDEVNSNNSEINSNITLWIDNMNYCFKKVNKLFNLNVKAVRNYLEKSSGGDVNIDLDKSI